MVKWMTEAQQRAPAPIDSLEHVVYGGAPMYREDLRAALDAFGPVFSQIYGQAEAPVTIARLTREDHQGEPDDGADRLGAAGRAYTSVEVAVCDAAGRIAPSGDGELLTRSDVVMKGYWRNPAATADSLRGGWLHTGDVGRIDSDGLVFLIDRSKDVIISGGANVYPREVEEVILRHDGVRQAVVVGAPDETWGERVVAVLVLEPGGDQRPRAAATRRAVPRVPLGLQAAASLRLDERAAGQPVRQGAQARGPRLVLAGTRATGLGVLRA